MLVGGRRELTSVFKVGGVSREPERLRSPDLNDSNRWERIENNCETIIYTCAKKIIST
jgi:hypothetical protein